MMTPDGHEVAAGLLRAGDVLGGVDGDKWVVSVRLLSVSRPVYNLEVRQAHTFFVGVGGVWVHNCGWLRKAWDFTVGRLFPRLSSQRLFPPKAKQLPKTITGRKPGRRRNSSAVVKSARGRSDQRVSGGRDADDWSALMQDTIIFKDSNQDL